MPEIEGGRHTLKSHGIKLARLHKYDWFVIVLLLGIDIILDMIEPFHRFIGEGMMSEIMYPLKSNTLPYWSVLVSAILFPIAVFFGNYALKRDVYDLHHSILGVLYSVLITEVITDAIKVSVGRPRADFFWRCFPDGLAEFDPVTRDVKCHGERKVVKEGYRSFPSGHTSLSFAGFGFLSWYLSGKLRAFDERGHAAKLCVVFLPLLLAALVGVTRVDDYWHHWQDVFAGGLIGLIVASFCYLQYFPFPHHANGWATHAYFQDLEERSGS